MVSLRGPGCPRTERSAFFCLQMLGVKVCITIPSSKTVLTNKKNFKSANFEFWNRDTQSVLSIQSILNLIRESSGRLQERFVRRFLPKMNMEAWSLTCSQHLILVWEPALTAWEDNTERKPGGSLWLICSVYHLLCELETHSYCSN